MSNDPSRANTDPERIDSKPSMRIIEATEADLWDLDSKSAEFTLPTAQHIIQPAVEKTKTEEKTPTEPAPDDARAWEDTESESKVQLPAIGSLSIVEKIAISCLFAALALAATLALIHFSHQVPTRPLMAEKIDYPVTGEIVEIESASTYWREPVTTGENTDIVRRGMKLIPVLKLKLSSKSGAIRVFFRNEDGIVVGDGITRTVSGDTELSIAATAGFDDVGMHTAYRTGDTLPWVVQVFEGSDAAASRENFRLVLETEVSTIIR